MNGGAVLGEAWELYKRHWRHLLPIALAVYLLLSLFTLVLVLLLGWLGVIAAAFVSLAGVFWLQGTLVVAVQDIRDGRADLSIGDTLARIRPRMNTLGLAGILAALAITIGLALFVVPGLLLLTWWVLIVPVIVLERAGVVRSFGRSRELVSGYAWRVFGLILVTIVVLVVASLGVRIALAWLPDAVEAYVANVASNTITAPFVALAFTLAYYRLREARERVAVDVSPTAGPSTFEP